MYGVIVEYRLKCCNSCYSWSKENISLKFSGIVENSFSCKSWNFGKKSLSVVEKLHFVKWNIFNILSHLAIFFAFFHTCLSNVCCFFWHASCFITRFTQQRKLNICLLYKCHTATVNNTYKWIKYEWIQCKPVNIMLQHMYSDIKIDIKCDMSSGSCLYSLMCSLSKSTIFLNYMQEATEVFAIFTPVGWIDVLLFA